MGYGPPMHRSGLLLLSIVSSAWVGIACTSRSQGPSEAPNDTPSETPNDTPSEAPNDTPSEAPRETPSETPNETPSQVEDCYPYLPTPEGTCPDACASIEDCAGSRGPADFAENGWPLDCINARCVPLPPEAVEL